MLQCRRSNDVPTMPPKRRNKCMVERSRELRQKMTLPENILWQFLRGSTFAGLRFRRQRPIGLYITDFCCTSKKLIVELDGEYHERIKQEDKERDDFLRERGFAILRFTNDQVFKRIEWVLQTIADELRIDWNKNYDDCVTDVKFPQKLHRLLAGAKKQQEPINKEGSDSVFE